MSEAVRYAEQITFVRWPSVIKEIRGISPLAGEVTLIFPPLDDKTGLVKVRINDGPDLYLQDCGTYWKPAGVDIPITDMLLD